MPPVARGATTTRWLRRGATEARGTTDGNSDGEDVDVEGIAIIDADDGCGATSGRPPPSNGAIFLLLLFSEARAGQTGLAGRKERERKRERAIREVLLSLLEKKGDETALGRRISETERRRSRTIFINLFNFFDADDQKRKKARVALFLSFPLPRRSKAPNAHRSHARPLHGRVARLG
jgi:hypothetical protein